MSVTDPATGRPVLGPTGQPITQNVPIPGQAGQFWQGVGGTAGGIAQRLLEATARPVIYAGLGSIGHAAVYCQWDELRSWILDTFGGEDDAVTVSVPVPGT